MAYFINIINTNIINITIDQLDMKLRNLKANRNKEKITGIMNSVFYIIQNSILYKIIHNAPLLANEV